MQQIEKEQQVKVQEAEINRREKELIATVLKGAEIERQRIETLAAAEKQRLIAEAEGQASSIRAQGEAEAEIIFKKGEAEAKAMNVKAEAFQEYNQAAVIDKLFASMPEIVKALAAPLANVDKITIVSTGNGDARRHEQDHRRHHQDGGAGAGAVRNALRHAAGGVAGQSAADRRQSAEAGRTASAECVASARVGRALQPDLPSEARQFRRARSHDEHNQIHGLGIALGAALGAVIGVHARQHRHLARHRSRDRRAADRRIGSGRPSGVAVGIAIGDRRSRTSADVASKESSTRARLKLTARRAEQLKRSSSWHY